MQAFWTTERNEFFMRTYNLSNSNELFDTNDEKIIDLKNSCEKDYKNLITEIKNLPPHFCSCRENIFEALDKYLLSQSLLSSYEHDYFYKCRICKFFERA